MVSVTVDGCREGKGEKTPGNHVADGRLARIFVNGYDRSGRISCGRRLSF